MHGNQSTSFSKLNKMKQDADWLPCIPAPFVSIPSMYLTNSMGINVIDYIN